MKNNVKYLVTGAAGFLGGTICRQLIERGENVRAFVLPGDPAMKYVPQEAEIVEGDLTDMDSLEKLFAVEEGTETIVLHIASAVEEGTETIVLHIASIVTVNPDYSSKVMEVKNCRPPTRRATRENKITVSRYRKWLHIKLSSNSLRDKSPA